ncbi:helix-turn-helix transcriptional regulator [Pedobacter sp. PAMC26386]|nr:helix-turn-helix transcriptional regulator [Pedobacter sp. PAMC26386]
MSKTISNPSDFVNAEISGEHFISEHTFFYIKKGTTKCYDENKIHIFKSGDFGLIRKNRLARYSKEKGKNENETVFIIFDEPFLKKIQEKHKNETVKTTSSSTFLRVTQNKLIPNFIHSLMPYYSTLGKIDNAFADIKREELLTILLQSQPELVGIFFDYGIPGKINLEDFMNKNFKFNVNILRFAYLTGRSLSAFKRDFKQIFNETPNRWLIQKRLQEAYFLIDKKNEKSSKIYLDLGFETLQHFSFAFKKQFGLTPIELLDRKTRAGRTVS